MSADTGVREKNKDPEIIYGRELFKEVSKMLPQGFMCAEKIEKGGLVKIGIQRKAGKSWYSIRIIEIGKNAPIKRGDVEKVIEAATAEIDHNIKQDQNGANK